MLGGTHENRRYQEIAASRNYIVCFAGFVVLGIIEGAWMTGFEWLASSGLIAAVIVLIAILFVWRTLKDRRAGFPAVDERTQRIDGRAATMALNAGWYFIIAILIGTIIAREFLGVPSFSEDFYSYSLIAVLLIQSVSFGVLRSYFGRRGDSWMAFRTRIKELRARYNLTQEELAKKVGVRRETILFVENGKYAPSLTLAHDLAKVLQTKIDDLFIFDDD
jgi:putative transcriptional regulator